MTRPRSRPPGRLPWSRGAWYSFAYARPATVAMVEHEARRAGSEEVLIDHVWAGMRRGKAIQIRWWNRQTSRAQFA